MGEDHWELLLAVLPELVQLLDVGGLLFEVAVGGVDLLEGELVVGADLRDEGLTDKLLGLFELGLEHRADLAAVNGEEPYFQLVLEEHAVALGLLEAESLDELAELVVGVVLLELLLGVLGLLLSELLELRDLGLEDLRKQEELLQTVLEEALVHSDVEVVRDKDVEGVREAGLSYRLGLEAVDALELADEFVGEVAEELPPIDEEGGEGQFPLVFDLHEVQLQVEQGQLGVEGVVLVGSLVLEQLFIGDAGLGEFLSWSEVHGLLYLVDDALEGRHVELHRLLVGAPCEALEQRVDEALEAPERLDGVRRQLGLLELLPLGLDDDL